MSLIDERLLYRVFTEDLGPDREADPVLDQNVGNLISALQGLVWSDEWREKALPLFGVLRELRRDILEHTDLTEKERDRVCGEIRLIKFIIDLQAFIAQQAKTEREMTNAG